MATSTAEQFFETLQKSSLLSAEHMSQLRKALDARGNVDPKALAGKLVERNLLTKWQADELMKGRGDFFLGRYKLLDHLGAGARGTVYKAQHAAMNRIVALKVMSKQLVENQDAVARFKREVQLAAALNHPNIISAYDAANAGQTHFMVMEYVDGRELNQWLKEYGPLPIQWACEVIRQAALGLQHAHERGMVHRDIKPGNILVAGADLNERPLVKILDMGFARALSTDDEKLRLTQPWQVFGTPDYMSPEQAESTRNADIRADIFSLGVTLYKLLTAELPFGGSTPLQKLMARANNDAPPVRGKRPDVPAALEAVVAKSMARAPDDRYQTPLEFAGALAFFGMGSQEFPTSDNGHEDSLADGEGTPGFLVDSGGGQASAAALPVLSNPAAAVSAIRSGMLIGGLVGAVAGAAIGVPAGLALRGVAEGQLWMPVIVGSCVLGISLGACYKAAVAAAQARG